jgi:hypothetical protein
VTSNGTYRHYEGTYKGVFRGGKVKSTAANHTFKEIDWIWLEVTPTNQLEKRNSDEERVYDYYFAQQLPKTPIFRLPWKKAGNVIIVGPEKKAFDGIIYDVVMTRHTVGPESAERIIREPNGKQVALDALEMSGTIRFSLPDTAAPVSTLTQPEIAPKDDSIVGKLKRNVLQRFIPQRQPVNYTTGPNTAGAIGESSEAQPPVAPQTPIPVRPNRLSGCLSSLIGLAFALLIMKWLPILGILALVGVISNAISSNKGAVTAGNDRVGCWSVLVWLIAVYTCFHAWSNAPRIIFWSLVFITLLHIVSRIQTRSGWKAIISIITILSLIGYWSSHMHVDWRKYFDPRKEEGRARIEPPIPVEVTDRDGNKKIDSLFHHEVHWDDFVNRSYNERYGTTLGQYTQSSNMHRALSQVDAAGDVRTYWTSIYQALVTNDSNKLDSLANYFKEQRDSLHLNPTETAEAVVTFIQEIPYYLVHDGTCEEAANCGNDFMTEYHMEGKPCLGNMAAGIQGPYEFIHNLKGDCDTRSVLCYTILSKLGIPSSVWVSEVYGHSIIGIGVPASGNNFQNLNGQRHFATELTAKGFRVGMISPDHTDMDNWLITLKNQ